MGATEMNKLAANIIDLPSPKKEHAPAIAIDICLSYVHCVHSG